MFLCDLGSVDGLGANYESYLLHHLWYITFSRWNKVVGLLLAGLGNVNWFLENDLG